MRVENISQYSDWQAGERQVSRIVYLHGFASGPSSKKAQFFRERFAQLGIGLEIPDLADGKFERLTITGQLEVIERAARGEPVSLIGSSMGGYLAALFAARHPEVEKLVLMAPAFCFATRWPETLGAAAMEEWERSGVLKVFHYGEGRDSRAGLSVDRGWPQVRGLPAGHRSPRSFFTAGTTRLSRRNYSVEIRRRHPQATLRLMDSDHELMNVLDDMWMETEEFLFGDQAAGSSTRS